MQLVPPTQHGGGLHCKGSDSGRGAELIIRHALGPFPGRQMTVGLRLTRGHLLLTYGRGSGVPFGREALAMYKPNFCAECGERIACARWRLWTSRRFCADCARRFGHRQILWPLIAGAALFCLGLALGQSGRSEPPPLIVERGQLSPLPAETKTVKPTREAPETGADSPAATQARPEPSYGPDGTATERPTDPNEVVAICGARTQKGTPCKRRVRGTGRCWQHRGMPAMIPVEKRIVTGD